MLTRDGGEAPTHAEGRRPMTPGEVIAFTNGVAPTLNDSSRVDVEVDGLGGLKVTVWPDDTDDDGSQIVTFAPVTAVQS